ncbi:hypothetical protein [Polyangium aurulentum]|uniref:hypothetical protein n=1 Tax=Polyangium aurulentum TaxID=2567896 RepID=UPI0010AE331D|nr:hypothetical protein [Polyangium aurulentum]UQA62093.1 hypothetical protein E8A73_017100 [Polyangium aurulentum]
MSPPDSAAPAPAPPWSLAQRIAFRFAFAYFAIYLFPFPIGYLPGTSWAGEAYEKAWEAVAAPVGKHVLRLGTDIKVFPTGSGDTPFNYAQVFCYLVLATAAATVWSIVDRRRNEYAKLHGWLRIYVRYGLGAVMVTYGIAKFTQFPFPGPDRLVQPYGESSPMGLLWTFMGFSAVYGLFTGTAEALGGLLLFFRRTTTLGALVVVGVMSNVVMLNFCYDVPVKLFSSHLLLMALFLALPDGKRLADFFILNRPTQPTTPRRPFEVKWKERAWIAVKVAFLGVFLISQAVNQVQAYRTYGSAAPRPPLYGIYEVESFTRDGQEAPPLLTDAARWRMVTVNRFGGVKIRMMDDSQKRYRGQDDAEKKTLTLMSSPDAPATVLSYSRPDPEHVVVEGTYENAALNVRLRKVDEGKFLLVNRGFHWVSEYPFNK